MLSKKMFLLSGLACLLVQSAVAHAQIASIRVDDDGSSEVSIGTIVKLEAVADEKPGTDTLFKWKLIDPPPGYDLEEYTEEGGRRVYFATGKPGVYEFQLVVVTVEGRKIDLDWLEYTVRVVGILPPAPPGDPPGDPPADPPDNPPGPPDDPPADPPDDPPADPVFGLSPKTQALAQEVNDPDRADTAKKLAANYVGVAGQIAAGKITRVNQAQVAIVTANRRALDAGKRELWTQFAVGLSKEIKSLESAGKLESLDDYRVLFLEISDGLLKVR